MHDLTNLLAQMRAMMSNLHGASFDHVRESTWHPPADIYESADGVIVVVEIPGVEKKNISVDVVDGVLRISGVKQKSLPESTQHVHQMEIPYGQFTRLVRLPCKALVDEIDAEYRDGYLTIRIPRGDLNE